MKIFTLVFCLLLSLNALAQNNDTIHNDTSKRLIVHDVLIKTKKPLIVIDGFIYTGDFNSIDPKDTLSTYTLGNPGATNIYGDQGKMALY